MFGELHDYFEQDTIKQIRKSVSTLHRSRHVKISYWVFITIVGFSGFGILLLSQYLATIHPNYYRILVTLGCIVAGLLVISAHFMKTRLTFLNSIARLYEIFRNNLFYRNFHDLFFFHWLAIILLIYLPLTILLLIAIVHPSPWVSPGTQQHLSTLALMATLISFSLAILAGQIALFGFMFGQLLGKYSSRIAGVLNSHRAVKLLRFYPIVSIMAIGSSYIYGYPDALHSILVPAFFFLNVICLILTMLISYKGIHPDLAIIYAGTAFCRKIRRSFKPAILPIEDEPPYLSRIAQTLGLDWRDPDRFRLFEPPPSAVLLVKEELAPIFNAANKAIQENQEEILRVSLVSNTNVMATYTKIRASYYGTNDGVFSYCNDQMAALLKASSKSLNEYMIVDVIRSIGMLSILSLEIAELPEDKHSDTTPVPRSRSHQLSLFWSGLLGEAFDQSHSLMRSTGADESISQLFALACCAISKNRLDVITSSFISNIVRIHNLCLTRPDPYHRLLGAVCMRKMLSVWALVAQSTKRYGVHSDVYDDLAGSLEGMANARLATESQPMVELLDINSSTVHILTTRLQSDHIVLQDIFYRVLSRCISEEWEQGLTLSDLIKILKLLVAVTKQAITTETLVPTGFVRCLYEIGYLILRGLPLSLTKSLEDKDKLASLGLRERPSTQEIMENELFTAWCNIFPLFRNSRNLVGFDHMQDFFGILGMGFFVFQKRSDEAIKQHLIRCVSIFWSHIIGNRTRQTISANDDDYNYLQLLGAWVYYLLGDTAMGEAIAMDVAQLRPWHSEMHGFSTAGKYGYLGYPTVFYSDFCIPRLTNLESSGYFTKQDWQQFRQYQNLLMREDILVGYYQIVDKIRAPLRTEFYKQLKEKRQKPL